VSICIHVAYVLLSQYTKFTGGGIQRAPASRFADDDGAADFVLLASHKCT